MAVLIKDNCINCSACIDECPVGAIVDEDENPLGHNYYYVYIDNCIECVGYYNPQACADACPIPGCIVWGDVLSYMPRSQSRKAYATPVSSN